MFTSNNNFHLFIFIRKHSLCPDVEMFFYSDNFSPKMKKGGGGIMGAKATFNNSAVISWRSYIMMEKTGVPGTQLEYQYTGSNHRLAFSR